MTFHVNHLSVRRGGVTLVEDFSATFSPGRVHAVVGESGSGKTLSALATLGLLPEGLERGGGLDLGGRAAMVLQEPLSALNPVLSVGAHLEETLRVHRVKGALRPRALAILSEVGLADPALLSRFPHQLSGGQRQRVCIACALAAAPEVLIADEPTTALDASVRREVLMLLRRLCAERRLAVWLITHDLVSTREVSDEVTVMYAGRVVEQGATARVFAAPRHPYTRALLALTPSLTTGPLASIPGAVPPASDVIPGCRFHPRCAQAVERCRAERPALRDGVACLLEQGS